jgi:hypothetical protein
MTDTPALKIVYRDPAKLKGYTKNARTHSDEQIRQIRRSIDEFSFTNPVLLRDDGVSIGAGHGRVAASLLDPPLKRIPTVIIPGLTEAQWKAYILADNRLPLDAGWDPDLLRSELADLQALDFDLSLTGFDPIEVGEFLRLDGLGDLSAQDGSGADDEFGEEVPIEAWDAAWRMWAGEIADQTEALMAAGSAQHGITPGYALGRFLLARHRGTPYPRLCSLAFHPQQPTTKGASYSVIEGLRRVASGDAQTERLRFACQEKMGLRVLGAPPPFGGARMPQDFPAELARDLINEFASGGCVLDPCHGWGGRLVGFLLSSATLYAGTDPSPMAASGTRAIRDLFLPYAAAPKEAILADAPFEDWDIPAPNATGFDLAITSPPYFNVERYEGSEQSHAKFDTYGAWRDGFYATLIAKTHAALRPGGVFVLQIGSQTFPLLEDGKTIAESVGFSVQDVRETSIARPNDDPSTLEGEVCLILRKPRRVGRKT